MLAGYGIISMINEELLQGFFCDFLIARGISISKKNINHFNFTGSGSIDSFEILSMIMELEMLTNIHLSPDELMDENNATVGGLIETLLRKQ